MSWRGRACARWQGQVVGGGLVGRGSGWRGDRLAGSCSASGRRTRGRGLPPLARPLWRTPGSASAGRADGSPEGPSDACSGLGAPRGPRRHGTLGERRGGAGRCHSVEGRGFSLGPPGLRRSGWRGDRSRKLAEQSAKGRQPVGGGRLGAVRTGGERGPHAAPRLPVWLRAPSRSRRAAEEHDFPALLSPLAQWSQGRVRGDPGGLGPRTKHPHQWSERRLRGVSSCSAQCEERSVPGWHDKNFVYISYKICQRNTKLEGAHSLKITRSRSLPPL